MADDLRTRPAIVGGLIAGVLSVLPIIQSCCCLWALAGGVVAAQMLIARSPARVTSNEVARVGLTAGMLAGFIYFVIGLPLTLATTPLSIRFIEWMSTVFTDPKVQDMLRQSVDMTRDTPLRTRALFMVPQFLVVGVLIAGFTVLGALLGRALFEKRRDEPPPPMSPPPPPPPPYEGGGFQPPPSYGG
jgi:hypothetical protein